MGISIGGGLGPFRARVGTRGGSVGVGPISMGTGWGRRRGGGDLGTLIGFGILVSIVVLVVWMVVAWPFLLGCWVAEQLGAHNPSTVRTGVGVVFECLYVVALVGVGLAVRQRRQDAQAEARHQQQLRAERRQQQHEADVRDVVAEYDQRLAQRALLRQLPAHVQGRADEWLVDTFEGVHLLSPRSAGRGGPRVQAPVDRGVLHVTTRRYLFLGQGNAVSWDHDKVVEARREDGTDLLISVTSRQTVKGLRLISAAERLRVALAVQVANDPSGHRLDAALRELRPHAELPLVVSQPVAAQVAAPLEAPPVAVAAPQLPVVEPAPFPARPIPASLPGASM